MSAASLLAKLHAAGAAVTVDGDRLVIDAPVGAVADKLRAQIVKHKQEIISTLGAGQQIRVGDAVNEARHEIASLLASAYQRYATTGRRTSGDDRLAIPGGKSVHGVGL